MSRIAGALCGRYSAALCVTACLALLFTAAVTAEECPPSGFDSVTPFNVTSYVERPWFVQAQMPLAYQQPPYYCM